MTSILGFNYFQSVWDYRNYPPLRNVYNVATCQSQARFGFIIVYFFQTFLS